MNPIQMLVLSQQLTSLGLHVRSIELEASLRVDRKRGDAGETKLLRAIEAHVTIRGSVSEGTAINAGFVDRVIEFANAGQSVGAAVWKPGEWGENTNWRTEVDEAGFVGEADVSIELTRSGA